VPVSRDGCVRVCAVRHGRKAFVTAGCLAGSGEPVDGIDRSESRCLEGRVSRAVVSMSTSASPAGAHIQSSKGSPYAVSRIFQGCSIRGHCSRGLANTEVGARRGSVSSVQTVVHVAMAAHQPATFAGVAQSVEHLFCKQAVRGSSPLPSSNPNRSTRSLLEGFPSGQWEQAVNLPAFAFVGSNPTPSTVGPQSARPAPVELAVSYLAAAYPATSVSSHQCSQWGQETVGRTPSVRRAQRRMPTSQFEGLVLRVSSDASARGSAARGSAELAAARARLRRAPTRVSAGVAQLVERQPSKLNVASSNLVSRSLFISRGRPNPRGFISRGRPNPRGFISRGGSDPRGFISRGGSDPRGLFVSRGRPSSRGFMTGGRSARRVVAVCGRAGSRTTSFASRSPAHLAQLVEHVLGKDEVISSILMVGSTGCGMSPLKLRTSRAGGVSAKRRGLVS
jgi:hypothetical protein